MASRWLDVAGRRVDESKTPRQFVITSSRPPVQGMGRVFGAGATGRNFLLTNSSPDAWAGRTAGRLLWTARPNGLPGTCLGPRPLWPRVTGGSAGLHRVCYLTRLEGEGLMLQRVRCHGET